MRGQQLGRQKVGHITRAYPVRSRARVRAYLPVRRDMEAKSPAPPHAGVLPLAGMPHRFGLGDRLVDLRKRLLVIPPAIFVLLLLVRLRLRLRLRRRRRRRR